MQPRRTLLLFATTAVLLAICICFLVQKKNDQPHTQSETVNDAITIIQELDKNPKNSK